MLQARRLRDEESHLQDLLQEISLLAGQEPAPTLYLSPLRSQRHGRSRSPEDAVVILTQGLLQRLEAEEPAGVLAHEPGPHRPPGHRLPELLGGGAQAACALRLRPPGLFGLLLRWLLPSSGASARE